jgi:A/G-specific adenine glycosylase
MIKNQNIHLLTDFTPRLLAWYVENGRHDLPWRQDYNAYRVWVAEIMLQQTQVNRVAENFYYQFLDKFPDVATLAKQNWEEVYPAWKGLGYYRRGQNMIKAAQLIMKEYNGVFPADRDALLKIPGIGKYTAAAILSFSFDQKIPAVDTNISKILKIIAPRKNLFKFSHQLIDQSNSGRQWNEAMMDLASHLRSGGTVDGTLGDFFPEEIRAKFLPQPRVKKEKTPIKKTRKNKKLIEVGVACIHRNNQYLIQTRADDKSFAGQWEFPGGKREKGENFRTCVKREVMEEIGVDVSVRPHFFMEMHHFDTCDLLLKFHRCQIQSGEPKPLEKQETKWVHVSEFDQINFLKTNAKALKAIKRFTK